MNAALTIRGTLTMQDMLSRYGFELNRNGFMCCPFHNEKTASFKVYADGTKWKCFGCAKGGTVIDFVMELFEIDFRQAIMRIDVDFGLNLTSQKVDRREQSRLQRKKMEEQRELNQYRSEYQEKCNEYRYCFDMVKQNPIPLMDTVLSDKMAQELANAKAKLQYLDYWFEENRWR